MKIKIIIIIISLLFSFNAMAEEKEIIWKCNNSKDNTMIKYYKIVIHKNTEKHLVYMRSNGKWEGFLGQGSFNKFIYSEFDNSVSREFEKSEYEKSFDIFDLLKKQYIRKIIAYHSQYTTVFDCKEIEQ